VGRVRAIRGLSHEPSIAPALLFIFAAIYFVPAIVAVVRHHNNKGAIIVLNIFLGWTVLVWIMALVWASTSNTRAGDQRRIRRQTRLSKG